MLRLFLSAFGLVACVACVNAAPTTQNAGKPAGPAATPSRVLAVTVYHGNALVTREVDVPQGQGLTELVVAPLPSQIIDSSLYTEGADGMRVLTTRYRTRAVKDDTRAEVRAREDQIELLTHQNAETQKSIEAAEQNEKMLGKLEGFTSATMSTLTDKGMLSAENTIKLATYVMETRASLGKSVVSMQQQLQNNQKQIEFLQRQVNEISAGADRLEREAVIVLDKANAAAGKVHLNYLVGASDWLPRYKLHAAGEKEPVTVEYLASIEQQSGEDWSGVDLVLSTAQPMLNAAPPELVALDVNINHLTAAKDNDAQQVMNKLQQYENAKQLRAKAQQDLLGNRQEAAELSLNAAAASEQYADLVARDEPGRNLQPRDGPSVAYHLEHKFTIASRNDQQIVEIARVELSPSYFYKTVPVLSKHVYRLATLNNKTKYVLLPGEATMYVGTDFVGRMGLPLVAIGEEFVVGFGIDPQIQVDRQLVTKAHSIQGGNQVQSYSYRINVSNFKQNDVTVQVWDRLPHSDSEAVAVELVKSSPELSADGDYARNDRPNNLLRWDITAKANTSGLNAATIGYEFKLQYARDVSIGNFKPMPSMRK